MYTILIVDDQPANIQVLAQLLKDTYRIQVATSGEKALQLAKSPQGPDLILLDIQMPVMDGYEVCKLLKRDMLTRQIPIIFVTAHSSVEDEEFGFALGAVDYITKPFRPSIVKARVNTHIAIKAQTKDLEQLSNSLYIQNRKLEKHIELVDQNIIISKTDLNGIITDVSRAFCKVSGYTKEQLIGRPHNIVRHPNTPTKLYSELWGAITKNKSWTGELKNRKADGSEYWVEVMISSMFDDKNQKIGYTSIQQDITDKKRIEYVSITDGLTGIYNRRYFNDVFPQYISLCQRHNGLVCFLIMDIDSFKQYNDHYGHQAGDKVLIEVSRCFEEHLQRGEDRVFRLGGEEFGIVFSSKSRENALEFANRIKDAIYNLKIPHEFSDIEPYITISGGLLCQNATEIASVDKCFQEADDLLYASKEKGKNCITCNE